jgi:hypothetical protein
MKDRRGLKPLMGRPGSSASRSPLESPAVDAACSAPVQVWRAWAGCGDGRQIHLIIDPGAQQVWLLSAEDSINHPRSIR